MLSFGSVSMLLWGLAISVPIILHLLRKRKSRTVAWGAMRFLQAAMVRRSKRFQFWRFLLLLLRVAALLALALAVARPLLDDSKGRGLEGQSETRTLNILVLDTSYSMRAIDRDETRFEVAKRGAIEVVNNSGAGDGFLLLDMGSQPRWIGSGVSFRGGEVADAVAGMSPGEGTADLNAAIGALESMVKATMTDGWQGRIRIWFFSDLQPLTWNVVGGGKLVDDRFAGLGNADVRFLVFDSGKATQRDSGARSRDGVELANPLVVGMQADRQVAGKRGAGNANATAISAEVQSFGNGEGLAGPVLVQLLVDGRIQQSGRIELSVGASRVLNWNERLRPGRHLLETRLAAEDAIALDNVYRVIVESQDRVPVALFASSAQDARFLTLAAEPNSGRVGSDAGFGYSIQQYGMDELASIELGRERLWVLCDPSPLDAPSLSRVAQHLRQGGGVIWWLGPKWVDGAGGVNGLDAEPNNSVAGDRWKASNVVGGNEAGMAVLDIDPLDYKDPIVAPFKPFPGSGLLTLPVFKYWRLELGDHWTTSLGISSRPVSEGPVSEVNVGQAGQRWNALIARLDRVATRTGLGREVIVATPPGPGVVDSGGADITTVEPWNALIAWPAFVPLVQEMFYWASKSDDAPAGFVVGQPISGQSLELEFGAEVIGSSGDTIPLNVVDSQGTRVFWTGGIAERSGVYRWAEGASEGELAFVVNVDASEGDLSESWSAVPPFTLVESVADELSMDLEQQMTASEEPRAFLNRSTVAAGVEVGWWFLLLAIAFLIGEAIVVRWLEQRF